MKLSNRLQAIADFIEKGASVADIGTDHGYLPVYLAMNNYASRIIASDVSAGSLAAARRSAGRYNVTERITLINAFGLDGVSEHDVDTIVIAGMGGETMVGILQGAPWIKNGKTLILQPQSKLKEILNFLSENNFKIINAKLVQDKKKQYLIICGLSDQGLSGQEL